MNEPSPLAAAGERRLRQLLAGFAIVTAITLAGSFIYLWLYKPAGVHLYFELQRKAALIYIGAWLIVSLLAAICACSSRTLYLSYCLALALCLEGASHLYFYSANGMFYHPFSPLVIHQFDPHPLLVAVPHPNKFGGVSHDSERRRTTVNEHPVRPLVYGFGGSPCWRDCRSWSANCLGLRARWRRGARNTRPLPAGCPKYLS